MANSFLSSSDYGHDLVCAVTQQSLNATLIEYFYNSSKASGPTRVCYVADASGSPRHIRWGDLMKATNNVDPFSLLDGGTPNTSPQVRRLYNARFMFGFSVTPGLPDGYGGDGQPPYPDIVTMSGSGSSVVFNMLASSFKIVMLVNSGRTPVSFRAHSQQPGDAWILQAGIDLFFKTVNSSDYGKLPLDVQTAIRNRKDTEFNVQQLLLDLDRAVLTSNANIIGLDDGSIAEVKLNETFTNMYFNSMKMRGQPFLHLSLVQTGPDTSQFCATSLGTEVRSSVETGGDVCSPSILSMSQRDAPTLDFLCSLFNNRLPPPVPFKWNWVETTDSSHVHGVIAINRNTFASWLGRQLRPIAAKACAEPHVVLSFDGLKATCEFTAPVPVDNDPCMTITPPGPHVLNMHWECSTHDRCKGVSIDTGAITIKTSYDLDVLFIANTIIIQQHLVWHVRVERICHGAVTTSDGNIIDRTITDRYMLAVDKTGNMKEPVPMVSNFADNSVKLPESNPTVGFFHRLGELRSFAENVAPATSTNFSSFSIASLQNSIFPGGKAFKFSNIQFSSEQDLYCQIGDVPPAQDIEADAPPPYVSVKVVRGSGVKKPPRSRLRDTRRSDRIARSKKATVLVSTKA